MSATHYVYHIKLPGMGLDEGYIGVTNRLNERFEEHSKSRYNPYLRRVFDKHGENLQMAILDCFDNREDAHWLEYTLRPSRQVGWNIAVGGKTPPEWKGRKHSEDTLKKMSSKAKGRVITEERRKAISAKLSGRKISEEAKARMVFKSGKDHSNAKPVNVYSFETKELVASNVVLNSWCKANGVQQSALSQTTRYDPTKPLRNGNRRQSKGLYAEYVA